MTQVTAIKAEIISQHPQFTAIAKVADVEATLNGHQVRVQIQKGEAKTIKVDGQVVWSPAGGWNVLEALNNMKTLCNQVGIEWKEETKGATKTKVTPEWIETLTEEANKSHKLEEGHSIRLRVATHKGHPVTAAVDIYREGQKIGTGGRPKKINFATRGITQEWRARVDEAVEFAYSKINK